MESKRGDSREAEGAQSHSEQVRALDERIERKLHQETYQPALPRSKERARSVDDTASILDERIIRQKMQQGRSVNERKAPPTATVDDQVIKSEIRSEGGSCSSRSATLVDEADSKGRVDQIEDQGPWLPPSMTSEPTSLDEGCMRKMKNEARADNQRIRSKDEQQDEAIDIEAGESSKHSSKQATGGGASNRRSLPRASSSSTASSHSAEAPPFFAVEATLVEEASSYSYEYEPPSPIYDAVLVPEQSSSPRWKSKRVGAMLIVAAALATAVGVAVSSGNDGDEPGDASSGTLLPSFRPPFDCSVSSLEPLFETDSDYNLHRVAVDGEGTVVTVRAKDSFSSHLKITNGKLSSTFDTSYWIASVALSEDLVAVGAGGSPDDNWTGSLHLFEKTPSGWNETSIIVPENIDDGADFGTMVAILRDVMVVSAPNDRDTIGSAFVYRRTGAIWQEEAKIVPAGQGNQNFGGSLALRGSTLLIGDNLYGAEDGAVFVYEHDPSSKSSPWVLKDTITNSDCGKHFGSSVGLTDDLKALVGCPGHQSRTGTVYYYTLQGGKHVLNQTIKASDGQVVDEFGKVLEVDGNFLAVGTAAKQINAQLYIFALHDGVWKELVQISSPSVNVSYFGSDFALSGDDVYVSYWGNILPYNLNCSV